MPDALVFSGYSQLAGRRALRCVAFPLNTRSPLPIATGLTKKFISSIRAPCVVRVERLLARSLRLFWVLS